MLKSNRQYLVIALPIAAAFAFSSASDALAAKKMSYEQAYGRCKTEIGGTAPGSEALSTAARSSAAGACMKKYGYRLKK